MYEYLKAVLGDAEEKPQTEEGEQAEEGKQGFIDDLRAWLKEEKKCRQDLADRLLGEIREKFEKYKTDLKENNNLKKEECEKKEKWGKRWCRFTASIAYGVKLTIAYVNHLLKLTLHPIDYSLKVAVAWLLILVFFLIHWALRIILVNSLLIIFFVVFLLFASLIVSYFEVPAIKEFLSSTGIPSMVIGLALIFSLPLATFLVHGILILSGVSDTSIVIVKDNIKSPVVSSINSLIPPKIRIKEGLKETSEMLSSTTRNMIKSGGVLIYLFIAVLAGVAADSGNGTGSKPDKKAEMENTGTVHNDIYLTFENTIPPVVNHPDKKNDKASVFTAWVLFPDEAKLYDWLDDKYAQDCHHSQDSQSAPNSGSCAVQPDKHFYKPIFRSILKWLSDEGSPEDKTRVEIVGFGSSSGVLSALKTAGDDVIKAVKEEKICYERTNNNGNENQRLSNTFNLCMAESRARNVEAMLHEIINDDEEIRADRIELVRREWKTYSEMCRQRGFSDTREEGDTRCYDTGLGLVNRRVELRVTNLPKSINYSQSDRTPPSEGKAQMPPDSQGKAWYLGLCSLPHSSEAQMPTDSRGETCGQSASPVVCSRNPDITNQP